MPVLQVAQKSFNSMGFSPKLKPLNYKILCILVIAVSGLSLQWMVLFHGTDSSREYMESIYVVTSCTGIFLSFASTIFITKKLFTFIDSFGELINEKLKKPTSKAICEKTNHLVEKYSKIGVFAMENVIVPCFILPKVIVSFFIYFTTDLGNDAFDLPISIWFPLDWRHPARYLVIVSAQYLWAIYLFRYLGCFMFLAFGVFMFAISFVKDLKIKFQSMNKMASHKKSRSNMYKRLSEVIRIHANAKQMFISFSDLYEITLTILFAGCTMAICVAMLLFQIEISHDDSDPMILMEATVFGVWTQILLLFVCELGQRFSNTIEEINDVISQLDWYLFPSEVQRVLPTVMQSAQQPSVIKCFGNVLCTRKQFRKVNKTIYSYFMVLRKFYK